jgi:hypothetical protein
MAINTLNFLNKNQFRSYPLKSGTSLVAIDGKKIINELFVGASITTISDRKKIFIRQIYVNGKNIRVTIAGLMANGYFETLGTFYGAVTSDFTTLTLTEALIFTSGSITIGTVDSVLAMSGAYTFNPEAMQLEESTIFYYTPPGVKSIQNQGNQLRGNVNFGVLTNIIKSRPNNTQINFGVIDTPSVTSLADKSSIFNNCGTPIIRHVDGATPFYQLPSSVDSWGNSNYVPELQGNLFMVGISPITFKNTQNLDSSGNLSYLGGLKTSTSSASSGSPITLNTLCNARNSVLPPVSPLYITPGRLPDQSSPSGYTSASGPASYYTKSNYKPSNFYSAVDPEFVWWPQFFTYSSITPNSPIVANQGTTGNIGYVAISGTPAPKYTLTVIYVNKGTATLTLSLFKNGVSIDGFSGINVNPNSSVTVRSPSDSNFPNHDTFIGVANGDHFTVSFDSVSGGTSVLQPYIYYR